MYISDEACLPDTEVKTVFKIKKEASLPEFKTMKITLSLVCQYDLTSADTASMTLIEKKKVVKKLESYLYILLSGIFL